LFKSILRYYLFRFVYGGLFINRYFLVNHTQIPILDSLILFRKQFWQLSLFLVLFCCLFISPADAESSQPLRGNRDAEGTWVPFDLADDPKHAGIFGELTLLLFERAGIQFAYMHLPTKRAVKALYEGNLDFVFVNPEWLSGEDTTMFVFSEPLFHISEYFISLPQTVTKYQDSVSAYGQPVGTVAGYYYYDDDKFHRVDFRSESEVILGLAKNRFEVAIMEEYTAKYWSDKHGVPIAFGSVHTQGNIVMRLRAEFKDLLPAINKAIHSLESEGAIDGILQHYTFQTPYSADNN
jgi:polar amino acid transport system substrate-binding protein